MIANLLGPRLAAIVVKELWAVLRDPRARISLSRSKPKLPT